MKGWLLWQGTPSQKALSKACHTCYCAVRKGRCEPQVRSVRLSILSRPVTCRDSCSADGLLHLCRSDSGTVRSQDGEDDGTCDVFVSPEGEVLEVLLHFYKTAKGCRLSIHSPDF